MKLYRLLFVLLFCTSLQHVAFGQSHEDSLKMKHEDTLMITRDTIIQKKGSQASASDSIMIHGKMHKHNPKTATKLSAIFPGLGQIYNRSYWKLPIVYGAMGITTYIFVDNLKTSQAANYAIKVLVDKDTANYKNVVPYLQPFVAAGDVNSLRNVRNQYRQYVDYAALVFIVFWGLNVVDATVDAHLKHFDVTNDLSMKIKPDIAPINGQAIGLSLVFDIHKGKSTLRPLP